MLKRLLMFSRGRAVVDMSLLKSKEASIRNDQKGGRGDLSSALVVRRTRYLFCFERSAWRNDLDEVARSDCQTVELKAS